MAVTALIAPLSSTPAEPSAGSSPDKPAIHLDAAALGMGIDLPRSFFAVLDPASPVPCAIRIAERSIPATVRLTENGDILLEWEGGSARVDFAADGARVEFLLMPDPASLAAVEERMRLSECRGAAQQLHLLLFAYAADHGGKLPGKLEALIPDYLEDRSLLEGSLAADHSNPGWTLNSAATDAEPLIVSKSVDSMGRELQVLADGTTRFAKRGDARK